MADLEDTFGPDFAEHVQKRTQERRQEREKIDDNARKEIADKAINEGGFHGGDPMFEYTSQNGISHNVLLMQLAEPRDGSVWKMVRKLDSGAISVPLEYLGEWVWSIFNDPEEAKKMEEGEWYIVVGNLGTYEPEDGGQPRDQLTPVRGVISLEEAKKMADSSMEDAGFDESGITGEGESDEPDDEPEVVEDDDDGDDESGKAGIFGGGSDDEGEDDDDDGEEDVIIDATSSEVANVVEELADEEEEVWDVTEDHPDFDTFLMVVTEKLGLDYDDKNVREQVAEMALDRVDEGPKGDSNEDDETDSLF